MKRLERLALLLTLLLAATAILLCATAETSGDFTYDLRDDGTVEITGYTGVKTNLSIPSTLNGRPVTGVGFAAFAGCTSLTSVTIPDSVTDIECAAFIGCGSLTSVPIPNGVTRIVASAFESCESLTTVTIPDSATQIEGNPFTHCTSLNRIIVSPNHPVLETIDGVLFNKTDGTLICYPATLKQSSYVLPYGVTRIGGGAFSECSFLESISIPDSVTSIGSFAFDGCSSLTSVTMFNTVEDVGYGVFDGCPDTLVISVS